MQSSQSLDVTDFIPTSIRVTWVDDIFDNKEVGISLLPFDWIRSYLAEPDIVPRQTAEFTILKTAREICIRHQVSFRIANFEYLEEKLNNDSLDPNEYFLLDISYTGRQNQNTYGMNLAHSNNLPEEKFRFLSADQDRLDDAQNSYGYSPDQCIRKPSVLFGKRFEEWLLSLLISQDPVVLQTLSFYSKPWREKVIPKWFYGSKEIHNDMNYVARKTLAKWLGIVEEEVSNSLFLTSAKSLLIWREGQSIWGDWYNSENQILDEQREGYPISGKVLSSVMKRLSVPAEGIELDEHYYMPLDPCLPFLLTISCFARDVFPGAPKTVWNRFLSNSGTVVYAISIETLEKTWGLRNVFYSDEKGTLTRFIANNVLKSKIDVKNIPQHPSPADVGKTAPNSAANYEWLKVFTAGVKQSPCGVSFTPGWVHLFWTSISKGS